MEPAEAVTLSAETEISTDQTDLSDEQIAGTEMEMMGARFRVTVMAVRSELTHPVAGFLVPAYHVPGPAGVKVLEASVSGDPPESPVYQSMTIPAGTVADNSGIGPSSQYCWLPPLIGGAINGQPQSGAVTSSVMEHSPLAVRVSVMFRPSGTPVTDQLLPEVFARVPAVVVSVPELSSTSMNQVFVSGSQAGSAVVVSTGVAETVIV
jgi:hypothetical protein